MRNSAKEKFRCGMCEEFGAHEKGYYIPVLFEGEITLLGICKPCNARNQMIQAMLNTMALIRSQRCCEEIKKKAKRAKKKTKKKTPKSN